jgi:Zn-finger protein
MEDGTTFFRNTACAAFPCHEGVDPHEFNCLFCYCPLYALGPGCGGDFRYTARGVKDCSACTRLHEGDVGASVVRDMFPRLADLARRMPAGGSPATGGSPAEEGSPAEGGAS